ncbi:MAG: energy transducer TonB [Acidobacteriota bacterium]
MHDRMMTIILITALTLAAFAAPPADAAGDAVAQWQARLEKIQQELDAEDWRSARRQSTNVLDSLSRRVLSAGEVENRLFAEAALLRALAYAGSGDLEKAEWDWHTAASFDDAVAERDLARFGEAGRTLDGARRGYREASKEMPNFAGAGETAGITPPRRKPSALPSPSGRSNLIAGGGGPVKIEAVINAEGRVVAPRLVEYSRPSRGFDALDLIKKWRFTPATLDGKPVPVIYRLTVNF